MTWLVENPMPVIYLAVVAELILLGVLVLTGRGVALFAMLGVAALAGVLLLVEFLVVTDVERVEAALEATALAIESNDADAVNKFIAEDNTKTRSRVNHEFTKYVFESVTIKDNLKIVIRDGSPKTAQAEFNVVGVGGDKQGTISSQTVPRFLKVSLREDNGQWVITDHEDHDFRKGLMKQSKDDGKK